MDNKQKIAQLLIESAELLDESVLSSAVNIVKKLIEKIIELIKLISVKFAEITGKEFVVSKTEVHKVVTKNIDLNKLSDNMDEMIELEGKLDKGFYIRQMYQYKNFLLSYKGEDTSLIRNINILVNDINKLYKNISKIGGKYIKENFSESILELITMIKLGEINKKNVASALKEIESKFPNNLFLEKNVEIEKPWNKKTLYQLWEHLSFCTHDKNGILYMAEIADYVYNH